MGDDINDLPVIKKIGLSFAPNDAIEQVKQIVDYVIPKEGGKGVFRLAVDIILQKDKNIFI
jgi:3-deoxy-D-manno-octulosonate 8-phosphate phosphatase (KDO 8-P phosphatase)